MLLNTIQSQVRCSQGDVFRRSLFQTIVWSSIIGELNRKDNEANECQYCSRQK